MMQKCPRCGRDMKPLFTGWFCPYDCDRAPESVKPEKTQPIPYPDWQYEDMRAELTRLADSFRGCPLAAKADALLARFEQINRELARVTSDWPIHGFGR